MTTWLVEPRDAIVLRNGRPVSDGGLMRSLSFPWPSSIAGLARTRIGLDAETGGFELTPAAAREISVAGPWLARLDDAGDVDDWFVPAPRDCVWYPDGAGALERTPLGPMVRGAGEQTDHELGDRLLIGPLARVPPGKPARAPAFWSWTDLLAWLVREPATTTLATDWGLPAFEPELRLRVKIDPDSQTADDGMLFGAEGLRFTRGRGAETRRYALALRCDDPRLRSRSGVALLGGERRPSWFRAASREPDRAPPSGVGAGRRLRVVLLTPAIFDEGAVPATIAGAPVVAAAVGRPEIISGWDIVRESRDGRQVERGEKATRRMVPAGSVYWVDVAGDSRAWAEARWMTCISSQPQDRLDGFGLCVVGGE